MCVGQDRRTPSAVGIAALTIPQKSCCSVIFIHCFSSLDEQHVQEITGNVVRSFWLNRPTSLSSPAHSDIALTAV